MNARTSYMPVYRSRLFTKQTVLLLMYSNINLINKLYDRICYRHPNCWKQRTLLEKILMIICVLAGIIIVALSITFYSVIVINSYDEAGKQVYYI